MDAWWIGCVVDWTCGGLDVKAAGKQAEVQKEQESVVDWTLKLWGSMAEVQNEQETVVNWTSKLRETWQKSKRSK